MCTSKKTCTQKGIYYSLCVNGLCFYYSYNGFAIYRHWFYFTLQTKKTIFILRHSWTKKKIADFLF